MNCPRCLVRLQRLGSLASSARAVSQHVVPLRTSTPSLTQAPTRPLQQINTCGQTLRHFHRSPTCAKSQTKPTYPAEENVSKKTDKSLVTHDDLFERVAKEVKTKANFNRVVDVFNKRDVRRRGHVEFIYAALQKMAEFGVASDLSVYNKLLDVFPKEVFVPRNYIQRMFNHYPRQQECGVQLLEQMENYGVMPSVETKVLLVQIFGEKSHPMRKYQRIMYWFPKFKHLNPFPLPPLLPRDPVDLARLGLHRIASDLSAAVTVYQMPSTDISETGEETDVPHVVGVQSPDQMELLAKHDPSRPVFVEGPHPLWLRNTRVYYYVLRADPLAPGEKVEEPYDPERCFDYPLQLDLDWEPDLREDHSFDVDDVDEGPVYAMCMSGRGDQATLNLWVSGLQESNPILGLVPTLFRLDAGPRELRAAEDAEPGDGHAAGASSAARREGRSEPDIVVEEEEEESRHSRGVKQ